MSHNAEARGRKRKIALLANSSWNLANFRGGLIAALLEGGDEVVTLAPDDSSVSGLVQRGVRTLHVNVDSSGTSPRRDGTLFFDYRKRLLEERPDIVLGYTVKPNVYGTLAARSLGIPVINNISGLGSAFIGGGSLANLICLLYRFSLRGSHRVFFQNRDDLAVFLERKLVRRDQAAILPGSGVDIRRFTPISPTTAVIDEKTPFRFLLVARLLRDKGVVEFIDAARQLRSTGTLARFQLVGALDVANPTAISKRDVDGWVEEGLIEYLGVADDVRPLLAAADCVVLPSYREGTPRTLLEAAAMARPLVATDVPGCREVVEHGVNGYLCRVRDSADLARAMSRMLDLSEGERRTMGSAGRAKMEREYDERIVIDLYLEAIEQAMKAQA